MGYSSWGTTDNAVGIAERNTFFYKVVSSICGIGKTVLCAVFHALRIKTHCGDHAFKQADTALYRINRIKGEFLIFLHILIVSKRNTFHGCQQAN